MNDSMICQVPGPRDADRAAELALQENPANAPRPGAASGRSKRAVGTVNLFWLPGRTLKIAFLEGTEPSLKDAVFRVACQWLEYANLHFELIDEVAKADITIEMCAPALKINYAWPGTEALLPEAYPTMKLSVTEDMPEFQRTVLHEFGHVLGAQHEHQHPDANIPWNEDLLYSEFEEKGVSREQVRSNFLDKFDRNTHFFTVYDPKSIMHYDVDRYALNDFTLVASDVISEKDKTFMRLVYPK